MKIISQINQFFQKDAIKNNIFTKILAKMTFLDKCIHFLNNYTSITKISILLFALFLFRFLFGLFGDFWFEDQVQIFLIGLKFFTTHQWPYFGPDLVYTHTQIPGALQSLLIALPLFILPIPEAPLFFLNILSFAGLALIAWYTGKRLPNTPKWLIWGIFMLNMWGLQFSTLMVNPSYLMVSSCLFFFAFLESIERTTLNIIKPRTCFFIMGFCLGWTLQLHASWTILVLIITYAVFISLSIKKIIVNGLFSLIGFLSIAWLILPTWYVHGTEKTFAYFTTNTGFSLKITHLSGVLSKLIAFAIYEIPCHIHHKYILFMKSFWALSPFVIFMLVIYFFQFFILLAFPFTKAGKEEKTKDIVYVIIGLYIILSISYIFTPLNPRSHMFYFVYPMVNMYALYCWSNLCKSVIMQRLALLILISMIAVNTLFMIYRYDVSLYKDRAKVMEAIQTKDYKKLELRRADIWGCCY